MNADLLNWIPRLVCALVDAMQVLHKKKGTKGIRIQHDWKAETLSNMCT